MKKELHFNSTSEILEYIKDTPSGNKSHTAGSDWAGGSYNQAVNWLMAGWPEGTKEIDLKSDLIKQQTEIIESAYRWEVTGDLFDVGTVLSGVPECWLTPTAEEKPKKSLKIAINTTYNDNIASGTVYNRGAVLSALIDKLHKDYYIELDFYCASLNTWDRHSLEMHLHLNTQNFYSVDLLTYLCANSTYLRRIFFAIAERYFDVKDCNGYGRSHDLEYSSEVYHFQGLTSYNTSDYSTIEKSTETLQRIWLEITKTEDR